MSSADGHAITTIEGIGDSSFGKQVQKAWLDLEVVQCGVAMAGVDTNGNPLAWTHRLVAPSILARWAPPFKYRLDGDAVDGAAQLLYHIPAIQVDDVRHEEPVLNTGFWRGVGVHDTTFAVAVSCSSSAPWSS